MATVAIVGATGHTGRFAIDELRARGLVVVAIGRDPAKLANIPNVERRVASLDALEPALAGVAAVVNCAGPFLDTANAVVTAAIRAGVHYLDVTAEQVCARATFDDHRDAAVTIVPAMAFYGGLADLLATAASAAWTDVDAIEIAIALDRWWPTSGTRATGKRNTARRYAIADATRAFVAEPPRRRTWHFSARFGEREVVELPFSEIETISQHLRARAIDSWFDVAPLADLADASTPPPPAHERSAQHFELGVAVSRRGETRRASATGRDIYAISAAMVAEAAARIVDGRARRRGALAPGELFEPREFLRSLAGDLAVRV